MIVTFIPAAGRSSRMKGRDKLLEHVSGRPILRHVAETAVRAATGAVMVGLRPGDRARRDALGDVAVAIVDVPDADQGMSATLRAGARAAIAAEATAIMIVLPDMPEIDADDLSTMTRAFDRTSDVPVRAATEDGKPGHPTIFPAAMLPDFERLSGDRGAAALLADMPVKLVRLTGQRARIDLDTPDDWAEWRRRDG